MGRYDLNVQISAVAGTCRWLSFINSLDLLLYCVQLGAYRLHEEHNRTPFYVEKAWLSRRR